MILVVVLGAIVLALLALGLLAAIAAAAIPALLADPTNWWAWLGALVVAAAVFGGARFGSRN